MNNTNTPAGWAVAIIILLVIVLGGLWLITQQNADMSPANTGVPAQTTSGQ
jgi:heme/copper-type cytochrome/quinol oxidase subunit 4